MHGSGLYFPEFNVSSRVQSSFFPPNETLTFLFFYEIVTAILFLNLVFRKRMVTIIYTLLCAYGYIQAIRNEYVVAFQDSELLRYLFVYATYFVIRKRRENVFTDNNSRVHPVDQ
uniref:EpsG family protein n=1 Tax=Caenorhabditis tropicalis TaxID=1561998 RepID=A0A1I7V219_9PELO